MVVTITKKYLGEIYLPTGQIVANDPLVLFETEPFTVTVEPGHYPVSISVAHFPDNGYGEDRRVAIAMLKISNNKPIRWEMAMVSDEQRLENMKMDEFLGYGVDSGTGGFMDKAIADKLDELAKKDNYVLDKFEDELNGTYVHTYSYMLVDALGEGHKSVAAFSSGFGDGCYPSYFGFDENDKPCALVTDFCIIDF
ncbi:MAG: DUF4241 domain-containing protein [Defluviitaleaceae bacterium]|nr:DUF4241 domain-containing protein [Defluviitaleaceae bacterium]